MIKRILVTGANGFIGSHLVEYLLSLKKYSIEKLDRNKSPFVNRAKLTFLLKDKDIVIHLAAKINGDSKEQYEANVLSTERLLSAIKELKPEERPNLFVLASTFAVYKEQKEIITEKTPTKPRNSYGETKLEAENVLKRFVKTLGLKGIILRFSNVYGPGAKPFSNSVVATFLEQTKKGDPLTVNGDGLQVRDFVYVDDVIGAIEKVVDHKWKSNKAKIFNISSGKSISLNQLISMIGTLSNKKQKINYIATKNEDRGCWIGSYRKAWKELRWKPRISLKEGLKRTIEQ